MSLEYRIAFFKEKYPSNRRIMKKMKEIDKLYHKSLLEKSMSDKLYFVLSEIELINYFENLLSISISENEIEYPISGINKKKSDFSFNFESQRILIEVKTLRKVANLVTIAMNGEVSSEISNPVKTAEELRYRILSKTQNKLTGLSSQITPFPFIIALGPYCDLMVEPSTVIEAIQSIHIRDIDSKRVILEDSKRDPYNLFNQTKDRLSGILYTRPRINNKNEPDLDVIYAINYHAKSQITNKLFNLLNDRFNKGLTPFKFYPSKIRYYKEEKSSK